jgi:tetratricopeptide (TPR) repeat protein
MKRSLLDRRLGWLALCLWLAACSTPPHEPADAMSMPVETVPNSSVAAFERAQLERALQFTQQGRYAEAAEAWEVLLLLRPDVAAYRDRLEQARAKAESDAGDHLRRAEQARRRGDLDVAQTQYLMVLQLQPDHTQAADALRAIERERNRRSYLGRLSRVTLGKRGGGGTEPAPIAKAPASAPQSSAEASKGSGRAAEVLKPVKKPSPP